MVNNDFSEKEKILANIAKGVKSEFLKWIMDTTAAAGLSAHMKRDTQVIIDVYTAHFDRTPHHVSFPTSILMNLTNLLREYASTLRLNEDDAVCHLCNLIGAFSAEEISQAQADEGIHNFVMNTRFLFKEKIVTICTTSQCPVPPRLSAIGVNQAQSATLVATFTGDDNPHRLLEDLLRDIDSLQSSATFDELKAELEKMLAQSMGSKTQPNYNLAHQISEVLTHIEEVRIVKGTDALMEEMVRSIMLRDRHRHYLEMVQTGIESIRQAKQRHAALLKEAESEIAWATAISQSFQLPKKLTQAAGSTALSFATAAQRLQKQGGGRTAIMGLSYGPTMTYTLHKLKKDHVVVGCPGLEQVEQHVQLTFYVLDDGLDITVSVRKRHNGRTVQNTVKQLKVSEAKLRELGYCEAGATTDMPIGGQAKLVFECSNFVALVKGLARGG